MTLGPGCPPDPARAPLYVGVLEQHDANWPSWPTEGKKGQDRYIVRVVFVKSDQGWLAVKESPNERVHWNVGLDGKMIGELSSESLLSPRISEQGLHVPIEGTDIPTRGKKTAEFSNWVDGGVPRFRPLVMSSAARFDDPQGWKPYRPSKNDVERCVPEFRRRIGKVVLGEIPTTDYARKSILVDKCYSSSKGDKLINLYLDPEIFRTDGPAEKETSLWLCLESSGQVRCLDVFGRVVDAGDYDGDGESEVIFAYSGYNRDGYMMLHDGLSKCVSRLWGYH